MANFDNAANVGFDIQIKYIKERMKELKIPQYKLAEMIGISELTLIRNFKKETEMAHTTFLKICSALDLHPYLVPKEIDKTDFIKMHFN